MRKKLKEFYIRYTPMIDMVGLFITLLGLLILKSIGFV